MNTKVIKEMAEQTAVMLVNGQRRHIKRTAGAIFIGGQIITQAGDGVAAVRETVRDHRQSMSRPPLVVSDFENGCGGMVKGLTEFPLLMNLGAANIPQLAYDYGKATAMEAASIGVNAAFAPVCDLNINKDNPIINTRAVSDDPKLCISILTQIIRGMQQNGLAACAKHFPGDGIDCRDQHITTTCNNLPMDRWLDSSGAIFDSVIKEGVSLIMPGHITLPCYQKKRINGLLPPATLSDELLENLLRNEMGFRGVTVSDATMMGGFKGFYKTKAQSEVECFKAGCDLILWPEEDYVDNIVSAVENGYIKEKRLYDAYERIQELKSKYIKSDDFTDLSLKQKQFLKQVQQTAAERSITLIKNSNNLLPFKNDVRRILVVSLCNHPTDLDSAALLTDELKARGYEAELHQQLPFDNFNALSDTVDIKSERADLCIYAMFTRAFRPAGPIDFWDEKCWYIAKSFGPALSKTIYVSFGNPYFANKYFEKASTYINAYSTSKPVVKAFVKAACGEIPFCGTSPVEL